MASNLLEIANAIRNTPCREGLQSEYSFTPARAWLRFVRLAITNSLESNEVSIERLKSSLEIAGNVESTTLFEIFFAPDGARVLLK